MATFASGKYYPTSSSVLLAVHSDVFHVVDIKTQIDLVCLHCSNEVSEDFTLL
jgi:hypothetical protein